MKTIFEGRIDATVGLMFLGIFLGLVFLFVGNHFFPQDGQVFQVVAGVVGLFGGVMGARVDPKRSPPGIEDPKSSVTITKEVAKDPPPSA